MWITLNNFFARYIYLVSCIAVMISGGGVLYSITHAASFVEAMTQSVLWTLLALTWFGLSELDWEIHTKENENGES